jgi:hypothetical protein
MTRRRHGKRNGLQRGVQRESRSTKEAELVDPSQGNADGKGIQRKEDRQVAITLGEMYPN